MPKMNVAKSIEIEADPQRVFDVVSDFGTWTSWSPWLCAEPTAKVDVSENSNSVGSTYNWKGDLTGEGQITHANLQPGRLVEMDLEFLKPWKSQAKTSFQLEPAGPGTRITWTMDSKLPWFLFWMKRTMENMIGMDYERGLTMIRDLVESGKIDSRVEIQGVVPIGPLYVAGIRRTCSVDDIDSAMKDAIDRACTALPAAGISTEGQLCSVYHHFDAKKQIFDFTAGYILESPADSSSDLSIWSLPEVQALRVDHHGVYQHLGNAWSAAYQYVQYKKLKADKANGFEIYKNDPNEVDPADLITEVYLPLR